MFKKILIEELKRQGVTFVLNVLTNIVARWQMEKGSQNSPASNSNNDFNFPQKWQ